MIQRMRAVAHAAAVLLAVASPQASAAPVRVDFAGSIDEISGYYLEPGVEYRELSVEAAEALLGGSVHVGTAFSGYIVYDDSTLPSDGNLEPDDRPAGSRVPPAWALYFFYPPGPAAAHGQIGDFSDDSQGSAAMEIWDNERYLDGADPSSLYLAGGFAGPVSGGEMALDQVILWASGASPGMTPARDVVGIHPVEPRELPRDAGAVAAPRRCKHGLRDRRGHVARSGARAGGPRRARGVCAAAGASRAVALGASRWPVFAPRKL